MITPIQPSPVRYEVKPAVSLGAGWLIYEGDRAIAYCDSEAYARAICNALRMHRSLVAGKLLYVQPPANHFLN